MRHAEQLLRGRSFDIVVSNPPYILNDEAPEMDKEVVDFEPGLALFHDDPASLYRSALDFASKQTPPAHLYCETHYQVAGSLVAALKSPGYVVSISKDFNGNDRFLKARFAGVNG
jgi:release factor glutamine methyltransferase